nr:hypothetical protein CFP56_28266 [Quercus suber]
MGSLLLSYLNVRLCGFLPRGLTLEPTEEVQAEWYMVVEAIDSLSQGTEVEDPEADMVVRRTMTANLFLPHRWPTTQQQASPPPAPRERERP